MITHTIDSYWTQSQSYILKKQLLTKIHILEFCKNIYMTHLLELLDMMYKYEMDPASIV